MFPFFLSATASFAKTFQTMAYIPRLIAAMPLMFLLLSQKAIGQDAASDDNTLTVSAQIRTRTEIRDGVFRPLRKSEEISALISQRTRLAVNYSYKNILELNIIPQSVSIWGQANIVQSPENSGNQFSLFEAWAKLFINKHSDIKVGRQIISLDDERFFGALDWAQGARAHDALSFNFKKKKTEFRAFLAYNQNYRELYNNNLNNSSGTLFSSKDAAPYKWMQAAWAGTNIYNGGRLTFLAANNGFQNALNNTDTAKVNFSQTYGLNYFHKKKNFSFTISAYGQFGNDRDGRSTEAGMLSGDFNHSINSKFNIGGGSDLLSGTAVGSKSGKNKSFVPHFGTNHKFYGTMDYYFVSSTHMNAGLWDKYIYSNYKSGKVGIGLRLHQFSSPVSIIDSAHTYSKNLGEEIDLDVNVRLNKFASIAGGYSTYFTSPTLDYLKGSAGAGKMQHWAWVTLNITPILFHSKFKQEL